MASINLELISQQEGYPPVEKWHPPFCGDMDLVIKANGEWWHEGSPIKREKMVTLFSRILWREGDEYFLVTPAEKVRIRVEDVPFQIISFHQEQDHQGQSLIRFQTRTQDLLTLGVDCDLQLKGEGEQAMPYVSVRHGMWASFHRNVYYQLIECAQSIEKEGAEHMMVESAGRGYTIGTFQHI